MQIAALIRTPEPVIELDIQQTQFQVGSSDCGLFSIAYATDLAYENNPAVYRYKQELLRSDLETCLCNNKLLPFPSIELARASKSKKYIARAIYLIIAVEAGWHNVSDARNGIMKTVKTYHKQFFQIGMRFGNVINVHS